MLVSSGVFIGAHLLGRIFDQGLANTVGLATLRHGTNPISWLGIHAFGALPQMGGNTFGGDHGNRFDDQNLGRFYFARDPLFSTTLWPLIPKGYLGKRFCQRLIPRTYSAGSTFNVLKFTPLPSELSILCSAVTAIALPTIKFRFSQEKVDQMPIDSTVPGGYACSTDEWVSPLHIGLLGTIWESLTYKTPARMLMRIDRVVTGIAQLTFVCISSYFLMIHFTPFLVAQRVAIVAGGILAVM